MVRAEDIAADTTEGTTGTEGKKRIEKSDYNNCKGRYRTENEVCFKRGELQRKTVLQSFE